MYTYSRNNNNIIYRDISLPRARNNVFIRKNRIFYNVNERCCRVIRARYWRNIFRKKLQKHFVDFHVFRRRVRQARWKKKMFLFKHHHRRTRNNIIIYARCKTHTAYNIIYVHYMLYLSVYIIYVLRVRGRICILYMVYTRLPVIRTRVKCKHRMFAIPTRCFLGQKKIVRSCVCACMCKCARL